ncbi:MAG: hypothetical protein V7605_991 [Acidimicrobiaceae bacterium]|jgi:hypothetical protein
MTAASGGGSSMLFLLGTGRCGSSLLHRVVAGHGATGFVSNVDELLAPLDLKGTRNPALYARAAMLARAGLPRFGPSEAYRLLDRQVSPIISSTGRDLVASDVTPWLEGRMRRFFARRAAAQGCGVFTHKLTGWPRVGFLRAVFPDARFVHIVRDGRAVANSWLQMDWWAGWRGPSAWRWGPLPSDYADEWDASDRSFPLLAGLGWKMLIDAFADARIAVPPEQWLELRYEDLVADPRQTVSSVLEFAGLDWTPQFEASFAGQHFSVARDEAYLRDLDLRSVGLLDASLSDHLLRLGYTPPTG